MTPEQAAVRSLEVLNRIEDLIESMSASMKPKTRTSRSKGPTEALKKEADNTAKSLQTVGLQAQKVQKDNERAAKNLNKIFTSFGTSFSSTLGNITGSVKKQTASLSDATSAIDLLLRNTSTTFGKSSLEAKKNMDGLSKSIQKNNASFSKSSEKVSKSAASIAVSMPKTVKALDDLFSISSVSTLDTQLTAAAKAARAFVYNTPATPNISIDPIVAAPNISIDPIVVKPEVTVTQQKPKTDGLQNFQLAAVKASLALQDVVNPGEQLKLQFKELTDRQIRLFADRIELAGSQFFKTGYDVKDAMSGATKAVTKHSAASLHFTKNLNKISNSVIPKTVTSLRAVQDGNIELNNKTYKVIQSVKLENAVSNVAQGFYKMETSAKNAAAKLDGIDPPKNTVIDDGESKGRQVMNAFVDLVSSLVGNTREIMRDFLALQGQGLAAGNQLLPLYKNAFRAGMSLQEYNEVLTDSIPALSRFKNIQAFDSAMQDSVSQLNGLGIFGKAAMQLAGTMATASTTLGIPQAQLGKSMGTQVDAFKKMRDATLMTAEGFKELVKDLSNNDDVQNIMMGTMKDERAERFNSILQMAAVGRQMGLTEDASRQLTSAMLAQRKSTALERFKARGAVMQAGAITGMASADSAELSQLAGKKVLGPEDVQRAQILGAELMNRLQEMQNSGMITAEYAAEQMESALGSANPQFAQILRTAGVAGLTQDAGKTQNEDFNNSVSAFGGAVGAFGTFVTGLEKSPIFKLFADSLGPMKDLLLAIGGAFASVFAFSKLKSLFGRGGKDGGSAVTSVVQNVPKAADTGAGFFSRVMSSNSKIAELLFKPFSMIGGVLTSAASTVSKSGRLFADGFSAIQDPLRRAKILPTLARMTDAVITKMKSFTSGFTSIAGKAIDGGMSIFSKGKGIIQSTFAMFRGDVVSNFRNLGDAAKTGLRSLIPSKEGFMKGMQAAGKMLNDAPSSLMKPLGAIAKVFRAGGPLSFIFSSIEEAFTGEMTAALGLGDGIFGKLLGIVVSGFNGIFTGITRMIDGAVNWVLEGLGLDKIVGKLNLTKMFDMVTIIATDGLKMLAKAGIDMLRWVLSKLPFGKSSPWYKSLTETSDKLDESLVESAKTRTELWETDGATLRDLGKAKVEQNKKLGVEAKKSQQELAKLQGDVVMGVQNVEQSARASVRSMQANMVIATPSAQPRQNVNQQAVNTNQNQPSQNSANTQKTENAKTASNESESILLLKQQVEQLTRIVLLMQTQNELSEQMVAGAEKIKRKSNVSDTDTVKMFAHTMGA